MSVDPRSDTAPVSGRADMMIDEDDKKMMRLRMWSCYDLLS